MAIEVFNRREYKYILNTEKYLKITAYLSAYMSPDTYNRDGQFYTISNLYYDTWNDMFIKKSIDKPVYKEKLRLRSYGVPSPEDMVFLEIKKKYKGVVNKRRTKLSLNEAYAFLEQGQLFEQKPYMNAQVVQEITYLLNRAQVMPKLYIAYDRIAYFGKDDPNLRISFDTRIRTRRTDLRLENGSFGDLLLDEDQWIMEIKSLYAMPLWLVQELSRLEIRKTSFSKYGTEYKSFQERITNHG